MYAINLQNPPPTIPPPPPRLIFSTHHNRHRKCYRWRRRQGTFALHLKRQAKKAAKAAEHWTILWDSEQGCPYFFDHSSNESAWECPEKVWESGRHSESWLVCFDSVSQCEYYLDTRDFSVHPIDEYSTWQTHGDYYNPPPLAKIALKQEHEPIAAYYPIPVEIGPENSVAARVRKRKARAKKKAAEAASGAASKGKTKKKHKMPQTEASEDEEQGSGHHRHHHKKHRKHKKHKKKSKDKKRNKDKHGLGLGDVDDPFKSPSIGRASRGRRTGGF
jgi:hypothetical protein